jgi:hypothetical protein
MAASLARDGIGSTVVVSHSQRRRASESPIEQESQPEIPLESLALLKAQRPDVQVFNELQYPLPRRDRRK